MSDLEQTSLEQEREHLLLEFRQSQRYRYVNDIGEGGTGTVKCYFDSYLNRIVALKQLKKVDPIKLRPLRSMIREARLISYLSHPGIVSIYDAFVDQQGNFSYTMKLIEGTSLEKFSRQQKRLTLTEYLEIFIKLFETMAYVHDKGVLHLDLKPSNIMLGHYGELLIVDWGNARLYDRRPYEDYLSKYGSAYKIEDLEEKELFITGTPRYMSPEQTFSKREDLLPASDIFSVGILFYQMLSGHHPFRANNLSDLLKQIKEFDPPLLHNVNPKIPKRLSLICQKMLTKKVQERYQSFHEILNDIRELLNTGETFEIQTYQKGDIIFREGDQGGFAFVILSGKVEIITEVAGEEKQLAIFGKGECIGELSIFTKQPRTATVRVLEDTQIQILTEESIQKELDKLSPWVGSMISSLSGKFIELSRKYIEKS